MNEIQGSMPSVSLEQELKFEPPASLGPIESALPGAGPAQRVDLNLLESEPAEFETPSALPAAEEQLAATNPLTDGNVLTLRSPDAVQEAETAHSELELTRIGDEQSPSRVKASLSLDAPAAVKAWVRHGPLAEAVPSTKAREDPISQASEPFEDVGWFHELRELNRLRPGRTDRTNAEASPARTYEELRLRRPRFSGRSYNPAQSRSRILSRAQALRQACRKCGAHALGNQCLRCGSEWCESCGGLMEKGRCSNESCPNYCAQFCGECGQEPCACAI